MKYGVFEDRQVNRIHGRALVEHLDHISKFDIDRDAAGIKLNLFERRGNRFEWRNNKLTRYPPLSLDDLFWFDDSWLGYCNGSKIIGQIVSGVIIPPQR